MPDGDEDNGPQIVWTFPLLRSLRERNGILNLGNNIASFIDSGSGITESTSTSEDAGEVTEQIQNEIDNLEDSFDNNTEDDFDFSQDDSLTDEQLIEIEDNVFVPVRLDIEVGDTVRWVNNDDRTHRVVSTSGEEFQSGQLEPGEEFEKTFNEEEVVRYIDSIVGGDTMCGAILVGDVQLGEPLRCEADTEFELFERGGDNPNSTRSMSEAAEEKERFVDDLTDN